MDEPEPLENMGLIHEGCVEKRREAMQVILKDVKPAQLVGKFVKASFPAGEQNEHMWVKVTGLAEDPDHDIRGELNNDPILVTDMKNGDIIELKMSEIEQVLDA